MMNKLKLMVMIMLKVSMQHEECENSDHLYTPPESDDKNVIKFPTYKSGEGSEIHLGMMFTNKEMISKNMEWKIRKMC